MRLELIVQLDSFIESMSVLLDLVKMSFTSEARILKLLLYAMQVGNDLWILIVKSLTGLGPGAESPLGKSGVKFSLTILKETSPQHVFDFTSFCIVVHVNVSVMFSSFLLPLRKNSLPLFFFLWYFLLSGILVDSLVEQRKFSILCLLLGPGVVPDCCFLCFIKCSLLLEISLCNKLIQLSLCIHNCRRSVWGNNFRTDFMIIHGDSRLAQCSIW